MTCMTSCEDEKVEENVGVPLTGITINPGSLTVPVNGKQKLTATPVPADATGVWFEWSSDDPSVATVYDDGTVFIKKYKPGFTTVTVRSDSIKASIPVSVAEVPLTEIITPDTVRFVALGYERQVKATLVPADATIEGYTWTSEDPGVATVDETGTIMAVSFGITKVTVSCDTVKSTFVVRVGLDDIIIEPSFMLFVDEVWRIRVRTIPEDYVIYTWETKDPDVAIVNTLGAVTGISPGTTDLTVSYGDIAKTITVDVDIDSVSFNGPHVLSSNGSRQIPIKDFDFGGDGIGFHDRDTVNSPKCYYRAENGDTLSGAADVENSGCIGSIGAGEWWQYTIRVHDAGLYTVDVNMSVNNGNGGGFSISVDGGAKTARTVAPNNSSYTLYRWIFDTYPDLLPKQEIYLSAGVHKIRFYYESGNYNLMGLKFRRIGD